MELTNQEVDHIAKLSKLNLSDEERESFRTQLSSVLAYVDKLKAAPVQGVEPMTHAVSFAAPLREDKVVQCGAEERDQALAQFPEREGNLLKVKAVFK